MPVYKTLFISILILGVCVIHQAGSTQTVTCPQRESAVLSFHFSHVSGPEGLYVSLLKMESIDGDTKPSVICAFKRGVWVYPSDHYKNRIQILTDLSNGKVDLILKDVKKEDEGIYKCQAANKEDQEDKEIRLFVTNPVKPLSIQKAEGDSVTFQADYSGPRDEVLWKIGPDKLVELDENESHYYRLSDRVSASFYGGNLTIRDLVESDSGDYSGNILNEGEYHKTKFILKVTRSTQTVTCPQHESAVLSFHFSFISGPEDLYVTFMKMESIDGDAKPSVICAFRRGVWVYPSDQYKNRIEILTDLSNRKLDLILKDVKKEDEGIYKCQAANKEKHGEMEIRLFVTNPVKPLSIQKAEGDSVTFQADYSGPRDEVLWMIGPDKLVELDENDSHYYRLSDRASASFYGGNLTIRDLAESDSGDYSGNILNEGEYHKTKFMLNVTPSKPKVHYKITEDAITLYCESSSKGVTFEWRNSRGDLLSSEAVYTASPETLRVNNIVTCIVRNKESETSSSLTIEDHLPRV